MSTKKIKAGQFVRINNVLYRAKNRTPENYLSCSGCALNNPISCPNTCPTNVENHEPLNCDVDGLIFVKI